MSAVRPNPSITRRAAVPSFSYQMSPVPLGHSLEAQVKKQKILMLSCHLGLHQELSFDTLIKRCGTFIRPLRGFFMFVRFLSERFSFKFITSCLVMRWKFKLLVSAHGAQCKLILTLEGCYCVTHVTLSLYTSICDAVTPAVQH